MTDKLMEALKRTAALMGLRGEVVKAAKAWRLARRSTVRPAMDATAAQLEKALARLEAYEDDAPKPPPDAA